MANNMPGFASDIAADPLGQRRYNIPNLPFKDMRRQGPVDRLDESVGERSRNMPFADRLKRLFPQGQMPPELLQMLMMQLMGSQGGGRAPQRPPMGGGRPQRRPPMGGSRPPVVKLEDLMAAMTQGPPGTQQANMPVPQARGRIGR